MAYTKTNWENLPSTNTPVNATNLNKIETQLGNVSNKGTLIAFVNAVVTSDVQVNNSDVLIPFGRITNNTSSFTLNQNGGIVCPFGGVVCVTTSLMFNNRQGYSGITILKNGTVQADAYFAKGEQDYGYEETSNRAFSVAAGDVITITAKASAASGTNLETIVGNNRSRISIFYLNVNY